MRLRKGYSGNLYDVDGALQPNPPRKQTRNLTPPTPVVEESKVEEVPVVVEEEVGEFLPQPAPSIVEVLVQEKKKTKKKKATS